MAALAQAVLRFRQTGTPIYIDPTLPQVPQVGALVTASKLLDKFRKACATWNPMFAPCLRSTLQEVFFVFLVMDCILVSWLLWSVVFSLLTPAAFRWKAKQHVKPVPDCNSNEDARNGEDYNAFVCGIPERAAGSWHTHDAASGSTSALLEAYGVLGANLGTWSKRGTCTGSEVLPMAEQSN